MFAIVVKESCARVGLEEEDHDEDTDEGTTNGS